MLAADNMITWHEIEDSIEKLEKAIQTEDHSIIDKIFSKVVEGFSAREKSSQS